MFLKVTQKAESSQLPSSAEVSLVIKLNMKDYKLNNGSKKRRGRPLEYSLLKKKFIVLSQNKDSFHELIRENGA